MNISTTHADARYQACRNPALKASLALLASSDATRSTITFYGGTMPDAGAATSSTALAVVQLSQAAGTVDEVAHRLVIATPVEGQVTGADAAAGTTCTWARVAGPTGAWWADLTVSGPSGGGEIKLSSALLINGGFVRVNSAEVTG